MPESERGGVLSVLEARVIVLETVMKGLEKELETLSALLKEHMAKEEEERKELIKTLSAIQGSVIRYKGVVGGIMLSASAISVLIGLGIQYLKNHN